jgi:hypothetical protein
MFTDEMLPVIRNQKEKANLISQTGLYLMPATTGFYPERSRRTPTHFRVQYNRPCGSAGDQLFVSSRGSYLLERDHQLVWTFDFVLGLQEFFSPWLARALGALVDHVANSETVIAGSFGARARELLTCLAGLEELAFERSVLAP